MSSKILNPIRKISIRLRLTFLFVGIFGASLSAFGLITFEYLSQSLQREFDNALYNYAVDISEGVILDPSGDLSLLPAKLDRIKIYPFALGTALIQIRHRNGKVLEQFGNFGALDLPFKHDVEKLSHGADSVFRTLDNVEALPEREAESYRVLTIAIDTNPNPQLILQVAVPLTLLENQISSRKIIFLFGIPSILLLAALLSYFLSARALRPIREMIRLAQNLGTENLSLRLPLPLAKDEVKTLALTLNQMLARLEMSVLSHERFVADSSHQLLTPLTILKGELEQAQRVGQASTKDIESLLQEVDRLIKLVQGLLLLARVDAGREQIKFQEIDLQEIVTDALSQVEKVARPRNIRLQFNIIHIDENSELILGAEDLLFHLVLNLIENAVKYSPNESVIIIDLKVSKENSLLEVKDSGPGIDTEEMKFIFERFHRGSSKKQQKTSGHGLGLAIAQKIAQLHSGRIWAENLTDSNGYQSGCKFSFEIKKN